MTRLRRLLPLVPGLALLAAAPAAGPAPVEWVSPPPGAVLPAAPFDVIVRGQAADLAVDGRPRPWGPFAGPVRAARLHLEPGRHEIRVGKKAVAVTVRGTSGPPTGGGTRLHPVGVGADACSACHQVGRRDGLVAVGPVADGACLTCQRPAQFELKHAHPLEPLRHCAACHAPHGSVRPGLLRAPAKALCAACHDS